MPIRVFPFFLIILTFSLWSCQNDKKTPENTDTKDISAQGDTTNYLKQKWVLSNYKLDLFLKERTVSAEGVKKMKALIDSMVGKVNYQFNIDGTYVADNGDGEVTKGKWNITNKKLTLTTTEEIPKTYSFDLHKPIEQEKLVLRDKDNLILEYKAVGK